MSSVSVKVGTPLWKKPSAFAGGAWSSTRALVPASVTADCTEFCGVTVRDGELVGDGQQITVQRTGDILVRVLGPVKFGDSVGQIPGADYLSASSSSNPVGTAIGQIKDNTTHLVKIRTTSATPVSGDYPFQIIKVSENQVKVATNSALMKGLDVTSILGIAGLGVPMTVTPNSKIYLEILFDVNQNAILANIACSDAGWNGYPKLSKAVLNTAVNAEQAILASQFLNHAIHATDLATDTVNRTAASAALAAFANGFQGFVTFRQFYSYALIGFATTATGVGSILLTGADGKAFSIVQSLKAHLMLMGFCDSGVPSSVPMPSAGPLIQTLPAIEATHPVGNSANKVQLRVPTFPDAKIFYTLDGAAEVPYTQLINIPTAGPHVILARATQSGYFDSPGLVFNFVQT